MKCVLLGIIAFLTFIPGTVSAAGDKLGYGLVKVASACMRSHPSNASELETQATYGTPLELLSGGGDSEWWKVRMPDGYVAYVNGSAIAVKDSVQMARWRCAPRLIVTTLYPARVYADSVSRCPRNVVCNVAFGAVFEGSKTPGAGFVRVTLPDGRSGFIYSFMVEDFGRWAEREPRADSILDAAYSMNGVTYLWGGTTPDAVDCSGFTKLCYFINGLLLPRNASDQARCGQEMDFHGGDGTFRRGDLLFFGNGDDSGRITHVGIYDDNDRYIHASGRVYVSSYRPGDSLYIPRRVLKAVRILGVQAPQGVVAVKNHPWYF